jgi:seryl-tRNA synthetase
MLTKDFILKNQDLIIERMKVRNIDVTDIVRDIESMNEERKSLGSSQNELREKQNTIAKQISELVKEKKFDEIAPLKEAASENKAKTKEVEEKFAEIDAKMNEKILLLPNVPNELVPAGKTDEDNVEISNGGEIPTFDFEALPHWELAKKHNLIDFELGVKVAGAGFPVYVDKGAKLQRAIINFLLNEGEKAGYKEHQVPILVNEDSGYGTGQIPDKEGQMYHVTEDNLYLNPTAEVPLTNVFRDVIVDEKDLPIKVTAYSPSFRREAGSYGKDVKGLNRLHQFDKVEIIQVTHPDESEKTLDGMVLYVESLLKKLGLPYRIVRLCGGDLTFTSTMTYDFEIYSAGQDRWLEVSSVSNFKTFQSNRLKLRYKDSETGKNNLAHTLNGSALALPRLVATLLENYQTKDGIEVPECLKPYLSFDRI